MAAREARGLVRRARRTAGERASADPVRRGARALRVALVGGLSAWIALAASSGCLYPSDYTFDEPEPTGGGGAGGGAAGEDCLNGQDDDGDSAIDCADSECASPSYQCVASAPVGWTGYFALYSGDPGKVPECPSSFPSAIPYMGTSGLVADPATCSACGCGPSTGEVCDFPNAVTVIEKSCGLQASAVSIKDLSVPPSWDGSCYSMGTAPGGQANCGALGAEKCNTAVKAAAATTAGGMCQSSGGDATKPPVTWMTAGKACGPAPLGGGCAGGEVCQPASSGTFKPGLCIYKEGEEPSCPGAPFTERHVFYEDVEDTRECTPCSCEAPLGGTCTANITVYGEAGCTTPLAIVQTGSCASLGAANPAVIGRTAEVISVTPGICTAAGGQAMGIVTPVKATTFCCVP